MLWESDEYRLWVWGLDGDCGLTAKAEVWEVLLVVSKKGPNAFLTQRRA